MTSKRRDGEGDVVLVGVYSETDRTSMFATCKFALANTVVPRAAVKACRCVEAKGTRLLPYRLMAPMTAAEAPADWLLTGAGFIPEGGLAAAAGGSADGVTLISDLGRTSAVTEWVCACKVLVTARRSDGLG
jgi:hypothetical protein